MHTDPSFLLRVQEQLADIGGRMRTLQHEIAMRKHALRALEQQEVVLHQYVDLRTEEDAEALERG